MTSESQPELSFSVGPSSASPAWAAQVTEWLNPGGLLPQRAPGFRPRPGQLRLALAVAQCVAEGGVLVAEAGRAVRRPVKPGLRGTGRVEVAAGLRAGERVFLPESGVVPGDKVRQ